MIVAAVLAIHPLPLQAGQAVNPENDCNLCDRLSAELATPALECFGLQWYLPLIVRTYAKGLLPSDAHTGRCWALLGNDGQHLEEEYAAGIRLKLFSLSWRQYMPHEDQVDSRYVERKRAELAAMRRAGFEIILSLGYHDAPQWLHDVYPDSHYANQYGDRYSGGMDSGDLNLVFHADLRAETAVYIRSVFRTFGTDFAAVRLGGGRLGELTYPPHEYEGESNAYWAFDGRALAESPVPDWRPGDPSPDNEAQRFLEWYLERLVAFQNWQIEAVRTSYQGPLMVLYPSWGMRPGSFEAAVATDLDGSSASERNGEVQRGFDFARQIAAISDPKVIVTTTWLDADRSGDSGADPRYFSPVKYLAGLARAHPLRLSLFGENTGEGSVRDMERSAQQMQRYELLGMAWYNESELFSGQYAGIDDYRRIIAEYSNP